MRIDKPKRDYTEGVAITSSWHPDEHTHIEPCRYGKGSNAMGLLNTVLTDGGTRRQRWVQFLHDPGAPPVRCCACWSRAGGPSG